MHSFQYDKVLLTGSWCSGYRCCLRYRRFLVQIQPHSLSVFFPQDPHSEIITCTQRGCDLLDLVVFPFFTVFTAEKKLYTPPETLYFSSLTYFHMQTEVIYGSQNESV